MYTKKSEKTNGTPVNMILIAVFYQIFLILGESILLGRFKLGDEFLDVSSEDTKFEVCRSDG